MSFFDPPKFPEPFKPEPLWQMNTCPTCQNDLVCHDQGECLRSTPETDAEYNEAQDFPASAFVVPLGVFLNLKSQLAEAREENARLREALSVVLGAGWDGPLPSYIREQAAQLLTP